MDEKTIEILKKILKRLDRIKCSPNINHMEDVYQLKEYQS